MIVIDGFDYKNCLLLKDTSLRLSEGISVIRGSNLDRKNNSENGVGKTLSFGLFIGLLIQEQLWATKGVRNTNKSIMQKGFNFTSHLHIDGNRFDLSYFEKGNTAKYSVVENGKEKKLHGIPQQVAYINSLIPTSRQQLNSTFFISNNGIDNTLLTGTATQRSEFFESFFDLHFYDALYDIFNKEKYRIDQNARDMKSLEEQVDENKPTKDIESLESLMSDLQLRSKSIMSKLSTSNEQLQSLSAYIAIGKQIENECSPDKLKKLAKKLKSKLSRLQKEYDDAIKYEDSYEENVRASKLRESLKEKVEKYSKYKKTVDRLKENWKKATNTYQTLLDQKKSYKENADIIKEAKEIEQEVKVDVTKLKKYEKELDKEKSKLSVNKEVLSNIEGLHGSSKCPCCQQSVNKGMLASLEKSTAKAIKESKAKIKVLSDKVFVCKVKKDCGEVYDLDISEISSQLKEVAKQLDYYEDYAEGSSKYNQYKQRLDDLPKVKSLAKPEKSAKAIKKDIVECNSRLSSIDNDIKLYAKLEDMGDGIEGLNSAKKKERELSKTVGKLSSRFDEIQDKLQKITSQYATEKEIRKQLKKLTVKIKELEKDISDREVVHCLSSAYSPKGIRLDHIRALAHSYIDNLNMYIKFMLDVSPIFSCNIEPNHFDILAERHGNVADVRSFSKSETSQFLPVSALSLLDLMPDRSRFDTIVLDELEAGMSPPERKQYISNFVPLLAKKIPKVVLISPLGKELIDIVGAKDIVLTCKNKETTIRYE